MEPFSHPLSTQGNFLIVSLAPQNFSSLICMNYSSHFYGNDSIFSFLSSYRTESRVTFCVYSMRPHFSLWAFSLAYFFCNLKYSPFPTPPCRIIFFHFQIYPIFLLLCFLHIHTPDCLSYRHSTKHRGMYIKRTSLWLCYNLQSTF